MDTLRYSLLIAASALGHAAAADPPITPTDRVYEISVVSADGTKFTDCATFRENHDLVLLAGRGLAMDWMTETSDPSSRNFHAVADGRVPSSNPIGLAIHGRFVANEQIRGDAINDLGLTFTFTGRLKGSCLDATTDALQQSPYAAAPAIPVLFEPKVGSLAGKLYDVKFYGSGGVDQCLHFAVNGTLIGNGGVNLIWGMDGRNSRMGTFQAVGSVAQGTAGRAMRGELSSVGELRVHGLQSTGAGLIEIVGSGREVDNCIY
jgi:hypothetical protein